MTIKIRITATCSRVMFAIFPNIKFKSGYNVGGTLMLKKRKTRNRTNKTDGITPTRLMRSLSFEHL
jgi:hypothetical protein